MRFSERRGQVTVGMLLGFVTFGVGCRTSGVDSVAVGATRAAKDIGKQLDDLTGATQRKSVTQAAETLRERADQLDVHSLNETVAEINVLVRELRARVISVPENLGAVWMSAVDDADLKGVSQRLKALTETVAGQVERLDPEAANTAIAEWHTLIADVSRRVDQVDIHEANKLIHDLRSLPPAIDATLVETTALAAEMRRTVRSVPTAEAERALTQLEQVGAAVAPVVKTMTVLFCAAMVGLCVVLLWMTILLRRMMRIGRQ